ncbi:2-octaprenyl-6-methoxyphenol hydroxylase [Saliniradius amylolyticus]|uniref:2-octaprenyl-6-methoxyphenol hydroxylase n=1 Tax=Saliniradius amylolyticus TaxID=2183582 RepID=A0A2S2E0K3_9ALTE|nr:2-octaprenyl-6-methoxyphenyl hydroxylase [Saliniradius amylolyticus]AWL11129.1 2-octaprenyl-6-methoxyphenol hydroxylase [Saliniradius amylolyticus]
MTTDTDFDLVIVGGGTVGSLLALALQGSGLRLAVVEPRQLTDGKHHPGFDARVIALSHYSVSFLEALGLGSDLKQISTPIHRIKVSDQGHLGQCQLAREQQYVDALGRVVALYDLGRLLRQSMDESIHWYCPDTVASLDYQRQRVGIQLASGRQLRAKLLVVADGAPSQTAALAGIESSVEEYKQSAVIANVAHEKPHQQRAFERFTSTGPLALLPMQGQVSSLVWSLNPEQAEAMSDLPEAHFLTELQQAFGYSLGRFERLSQRYAYPLRLIRAERNYAHRTLVIGNAARTLHPIAGQGFNLGLRDVADLTGLLNEAPRDAGDYELLSHYHRCRRRDQHSTIQLTDTLVRMFSNQLLPLVVGRNLGLAALQHCSPLKSVLARQAMGYQRGIN